MDPVRRFFVAVEQDHPGPGAEHESGRCPVPPNSTAASGNVSSVRSDSAIRVHAPSDRLKGRDRLVNAPQRLRGDEYLRHSAQLVERRPFTACCLRQPLLRPMPRAGIASRISAMRRDRGRRTLWRGANVRTRPPAHACARVMSGSSDKKLFGPMRKSPKIARLKSGGA